MTAVEVYALCCIRCLWHALKEQTKCELVTHHAANLSVYPRLYMDSAIALRTGKPVTLRPREGLTHRPRHLPMKSQQRSTAPKPLLSKSLLLEKSKSRPELGGVCIQSRDCQNMPLSLLRTFGHSHSPAQSTHLPRTRQQGSKAEAKPHVFTSAAVAEQPPPQWQ